MTLTDDQKNELTVELNIRNEKLENGFRGLKN
ncbi:MAG: hypothetical protein CM1200mP10_11830 [Candidatus Neomarinimicrobiota bacterium]|nr:MAG: hypothetical protein CM1200mP10_11830 [Candidatus Neomarinimicrobiota bacterium]